jgi:hypothetical protein
VKKFGNWLISTLPPARAALLTVAALLLMPIGRATATWSAFGAVSLFSIADPFLILRQRSWWLGALLSAPSWIVMTVLLANVADSVARLREGLMIFMLPAMAYPIALAISGLIRLVIWTRRRTPAVAVPSD